MGSTPKFRAGQVRMTAEAVASLSQDPDSTHGWPAGTRVGILRVLPVREWVHLGRPRYLGLMPDGSHARVCEPDLE